MFHQTSWLAKAVSDPARVFYYFGQLFDVIIQVLFFAANMEDADIIEVSPLTVSTSEPASSEPSSSTQSTSTVATLPKGMKRKKSPVWTYFTITDVNRCD